MFDRETNTLWSHLTGEAIEGPLKGRMLEITIPDGSTWGVWRQRYPSAQIMRTDTTDDPYLSYSSAQDTGISSPRHQDGRLGPKERVVGVRLAGAVKPYAFNGLQRERVVNDEVGGTPVVLVSDRRSESTAVPPRELHG